MASPYAFTLRSDEKKMVVKTVSLASLSPSSPTNGAVVARGNFSIGAPPGFVGTLETPNMNMVSIASSGLLTPAAPYAYNAIHWKIELAIRLSDTATIAYSTPVTTAAASLTVAPSWATVDNITSATVSHLDIYQCHFTGSGTAAIQAAFNIIVTDVGSV